MFTSLFSQEKKQLILKDKETGKLLDDVRVEFKDKKSGKVVISNSDSTGLVSAILTKNNNYIITTQKIGYDPVMVDFVPKNDEIAIDIKIRKTAEGVMIRLENVVYEYNKYNLSKSGKRQLDTLYLFLKENRNFSIELNSHTDSRGTEEYNMSLSKKRSLTCNQYFISKGLKMKRILMNNFGESKLLNQCSDGVECSEDLHQINRRTEFLLIFYKKK